MIVLLLSSLSIAPVTAAPAAETQPLRDAVTAEAILEHLEAFQDIADANDDTRASGTPGYDASGEYVAALLRAAGYEVTIQEFEFLFFQELSPAELLLGGEPIETQTMDYSGSGTVTGTIVPVDVNVTGDRASTSGCEASDFEGIDWSGTEIALIQRGTCTFFEKAANAEAAGAEAVIIFNQGNADDRMGLIGGTLGEPVGIPVIDVSFDDGVRLLESTQTQEEVTVTTDTISEPRQTFNVIADTPTGRDDRVVVVGAHLDSVPEGPGIEDNGTGSAAILEIALQIAELGLEPRNTIRFAWWGAEESGLLGAEHYVSTLSRQERNRIMLNLNFDMIGSPNYVRFVYDGGGSATGTRGPSGSGRIEQVFGEYFDSQGLAYEPTAFDGRSDYGPFIDRGIPAGGLFTGAEGVKTEEQAAVYGGVAGEWYDPCYHQRCDDLYLTDLSPELVDVYAALNEEFRLVGNVNLDALEEMADAAAHAVWTFAQTLSAVQGTGRANPSAPAHGLEHRGHAARR